MTIARCGATTADAYWSEHRCGLPKGHDGWHQCYAVWWSDKHKGRPRRRMTGPCGFQWNGGSTPDAILDYTTAHGE